MWVRVFGVFMNIVFICEDVLAQGACMRRNMHVVVMVIVMW